MITPHEVIRILTTAGIRRGRHRNGSIYRLYRDGVPPRPIATRDLVAILAPHFPGLAPHEIRNPLTEARFSDTWPIVGHDLSMTDEEADCRPFRTFHDAVLPRWLPVLDLARICPHDASVGVRQWTDRRRGEVVLVEAERYARDLRRALGLTKSIPVSTAARALGIRDDLLRYACGPGLEWVDHLSASKTYAGGVVLIAQPYCGDIDRRHFEGTLRTEGLFAAGSLYSPYYPRRASVIVVSHQPLPVIGANEGPHRDQLARRPVLSVCA